MKNMNKWLKALRLIICGIIVLQTAAPMNIYSSDDNPTITVSANGCKVSGSVFREDEPLYPGCPAISNILRIDNEKGSRIHVNRIGMSTSLSRKDTPLSLDSKDAKDFLKYIIIKVEYKSLLKRIFEGTIYFGSLEGFLEGADCSIAIADNGSLDLRYSLSMHEDAKDNIEDITSNIDFTINIEELTGSGQ